MTIRRESYFNYVLLKASVIIDTIYGNLSTRNTNQKNDDSYTASISAETIRSIMMQGKHLQLREDQTLAIDRALNSENIITIQAPFGTGKTVVGSVITGSNVLLKHKLVIMTAVSQFTETLLAIDEFSDVTVLRFVSESASSEAASAIEVDLSKVLVKLAESHGSTMNSGTRGTCEKFLKGREHYENYLSNLDCAVFLSQEEREDYLLCERNCSRLLTKMIRLMFEYRPPSILCITAASLLNTTGKDGIFEGFLDQFSTVICDEASQIPEPVGVMEILSHSTAVQTTPLMTTFRSHPRLNELPNILSYQGTLHSGALEVEHRLILNALRLPNEKILFAFVDVVGESVKTPSLSSYNEREVEACKNLVEGLLQVGIPQTSIAIITFYREQNRRIAGFAKECNIKLSTVDAVQGREKDVVILLSTRTHFSVETAEFLFDCQRMNVALTRSRHRQFVLGHKPSLKQLASWAIVLEWAEKNNTIIKDHQIHKLFGESYIKPIGAVKRGRRMDRSPDTPPSYPGRLSYLFATRCYAYSVVPFTFLFSLPL
uniref:AAA_12 domain-containing protein n=1 Tax=Heterorhabditis bacteriophora TaxID=37862 RepID=A0A1I7WJH6_HETBA